MSPWATMILLAWGGWTAGQRADIIATSNPSRPAPQATPVLPPVPVTRTPPNPVPSATPGFGLAVRTLGPPALRVGKAASYEITVRNTGSVPLHQVRIEQELPAGVKLLRAEPRPETMDHVLLWKHDRLDSGAGLTLFLEIEPIHDSAWQSSPRATFALSPPSQATLVLSQIAPGRLAVGQTATLQLRVTNTGTAPAKHVLLVDALPEGLQSSLGPTIQVEIDTLGPGDTKSLPPLSTTAVKAGSYVNDVVATADGGLQTRARAAVVVTETEP